MATTGIIEGEAELAGRRPPARQLFDDGGQRLAPFSSVEASEAKDDYALRAAPQDAFEDALGMARDEHGATGMVDGQLARDTTGARVSGVFPRRGLASGAPDPDYPFPDESEEEKDDEDEGAGARAADSPGSDGLRMLRAGAFMGDDDDDDGNDEKDTDSVEAALRANPADGARNEKEKRMFELQGQIRTIITNKQVLRRQARGMRREQIGLKRAIATLEAERSAMGGRDAVVENDRTVRRGEEIMTRRIMKARADKMRAVGENSDMRREIDVRRREKVALLRACGQLESDVRALQDTTKAQLVSIAETDEETRAVETQVAGVIEEARTELRGIEQQWERLASAASKPAFGSGIPSPRDADLDAQVDRELAAAERELLRGKPRQRGIYEGSHGPLRKPKRRAGANARKPRAEGKAREDVAASAAAVMRMRVDTRPSWAPKGTKGAPSRRGKSSTSSKGGAGPAPPGRPSSSQSAASSQGGSATADGGGGRPTSRTLMRSRWKNAAMHARVGNTRTRVERLRAAYSELQSLFGGETPSETVELVLGRKEEVGRLYGRIDKLGHEADGLRAAIMECRREGREGAVRQRVEAAERHGMLASVESSLTAARRREVVQAAERARLEGTLSALHDGLVGVLESLDMGSVVRGKDAETKEAAGAVAAAAAAGGADGGGRAVTPNGGAAAAPSAPNARLIAGYFSLAEHRLSQVLAEYSRLSGRAKARGGAGGGGRSARGRQGAEHEGAGGGGREQRGGSAGSGARGARRGSVSGGGAAAAAAAAGRMSRAERRRSIDLSIADMRRHQLMQAIHQGGGAASAPGQLPPLGAGGESDEPGSALPAEAMQIGPSSASALPKTLDAYARQSKEEVRAGAGTAGGGRAARRRLSGRPRSDGPGDAGVSAFSAAPGSAQLSASAKRAFVQRSMTAESRGVLAARALAPVPPIRGMSHDA